jgi:NitT/TauT family transport system substrate-binding protein
MSETAKNVSFPVQEQAAGVPVFNWRAIQKAAKWVQENPDETTRILAENKYIAGDPVVNAQVLKTYSYKASVSQAETAIKRNVYELQQIGLVKSDVDIDALVKNTYFAVPGVPDSLF